MDGKTPVAAELLTALAAGQPVQVRAHMQHKAVLSFKAPLTILAL